MSDGTKAPYPLMPEPILQASGIPIRLTMNERKAQRLMRGIVMASCYTDHIDARLLSPLQRGHLITRHISDLLTGLVIALDLSHGARVLQQRSLDDHIEIIAQSVEYCRRYKIMNPDVLRTDYVKFLYMIQDIVMTEGTRDIFYADNRIDFIRPILTVERYCQEKNITELLKDPQLPLCITPVPLLPTRHGHNAALRAKDVAVKNMCARYAKACTPDEVEIAIRSLNDANTFADDNAQSALDLMELLTRHFNPSVAATPAHDLSITEGRDGSRLSHSHEKQYHFVLQSLALWKNIARSMYSLWVIAEGDMLNPDEPYELRDTGQGLQRVQRAPNLYRAVEKILLDTKAELAGWVGRDKIHLGDDQVPNAFAFIDKYGQISRIVLPILRTLNEVDRLAGEPAFSDYINNTWGSADGAKVAILGDFFRHGFDGSGGDNMEDAGSCVDGRLTSAWNWCNSIRGKPFYPLFLMAGFSSFDGDLST